MYLKKRQENFKSRTLEASKQPTSLEMTHSLLHKSLHIIEDFFYPYLIPTQRKIACYKSFS